MRHNTLVHRGENCVKTICRLSLYPLYGACGTVCLAVVSLWYIARWLFCFTTGRDISDRATAKYSGIPPLATLFALSIAQGVTLLWANYQGTRKLYSLAVFTFIAVVVLGGMVGIMRARQDHSRTQGAFDLATIRWGTWAIMISFCSLTVVWGAVLFDVAPQKTQVVFIRALDYDWKFDETEGKKLVYRLDPPLIGRYPTHIKMHVRLEKIISKDWEIKHVVGFTDDSLEEELVSEGPFEDSESSTTHYSGTWCKLDTNHGQYFAVVSLHPISKASRDDLNKILEHHPNAITATLY